MASLVRDTVAALDRDQPVSYPMTLRALVADAHAVERTTTYILSFFALIALALAAMGIYGVLAHSVLERRHELAIRLALGAPPSRVVGFVVRQLVWMVAPGFVVGLAGALAAGRLLNALLYGVSARDPVLLGAVVLLLALVAAAAALVPLKRALGTDPMLVLREE
jgi:ABC-type antimicrobial peptide transport system permease subunit